MIVIGTTIFDAVARGGRTAALRRISFLLKAFGRPFQFRLDGTAMIDLRWNDARYASVMFSV